MSKLASINAARSFKATKASTRNGPPGSPGAPSGHFNVDGGGSVDDLVATVKELEADLAENQEEFVKNERAYKLRIEELESGIHDQRKEKTGWMKSNDKMTTLKDMQSDILNRVGLVQDRTAIILQEQEADLLRAFRSRLFDVQAELEKEKSKKDDGAIAWIERSRRLESEVEWTKEVADKLEGVNQALVQENTRLQSQFQYSKQEHGFMLEKLASMTAENELLRKRYTDKEAENERFRTMTKALQESQSNVPVNTKGTKHIHHDSDDKLKENNARLTKQLEDEKRALKAVQENLRFELNSQTELEKIIRSCVDDVRKEIARRNLENGQGMHHHQSTADLARLYITKPALVPIEDFDSLDRERLLELLLSQDRVVQILYGNKSPVGQGLLTGTMKSRLGLLAGTGVEHGATGHNNSSSSANPGLLGLSYDELMSPTNNNNNNNNNNHNHDGSAVGTGAAGRPATTNSVELGYETNSNNSPTTIGAAAVGDGNRNGSSNNSNDGKLPAIGGARPNTVGNRSGSDIHLTPLHSHNHKLNHYENLI